MDVQLFMWGVDVRAWSHMCRGGEMGHPAWRGSIGLHSKVQRDLTTRAETCGGQRGSGGQFAWATMARAQGQEGPVGDCTISLHNLLWVTVVWRKVECATLLKKCSSCSKTFGSQDDQCGKRTTMRARFE